LQGKGYRNLIIDGVNTRIGWSLPSLSGKRNVPVLFLLTNVNILSIILPASLFLQQKRSKPEHGQSLPGTDLSGALARNSIPERDQILPGGLFCCKQNGGIQV